MSCVSVALVTGNTSSEVFDITRLRVGHKMILSRFDVISSVVPPHPVMPLFKIHYPGRKSMKSLRYRAFIGAFILLLFLFAATEKCSSYIYTALVGNFI